MHLLATEGVAARKARLRPARVPVVAVGDDHVLVVPGLGPFRLERPHRDVVPAVLAGHHLHDLGPEGDQVAETEVIDVVVEVVRDLPVARVVGQRLRHRVRGVLHRVPRGVDVQRAVRRADAVVVAVPPVPADPSPSRSSRRGSRAPGAPGQR